MYDIIIVGGGPAGLSSAIYSLRAMKKVLVIEKGNFGGQIVQSLKVENYPGFKEVSGMDLGELMYEQAKNLGMESVYSEVTKIEKIDNIFQVTTSSNVYQSKAVIFATGASPKKLGIPKEEKFIGSGISYCATCDGAFFKGKTVAVVGGGNTAIDDALYLANLCKKVYLIHRREEFRAESIKVDLLKERDNVEFKLNATIKSIHGDKLLDSITILKEGEEETILVDGLFVAVGHVPNTSVLEGFLTLNESGYVATHHQVETEVPGFFVAGDICEKEVRQLTTATSDGTIASIVACEYLDRF